MKSNNFSSFIKRSPFILYNHYKTPSWEFQDGEKKIYALGFQIAQQVPSAYVHTAQAYTFFVVNENRFGKFSVVFVTKYKKRKTP
jgi:hypothetical protein